MNKLIKELALEALVENIASEKWVFTDEELNRFGELVVRECVKVVSKRYMGDNNREDMEVRRCVEDLRQHFWSRNNEL